MIRFLALFLFLAGPAVAEVARVYSGEHDGFTRLVIELPVAVDWTVGRTPMGYAFASAGDRQPDYDISSVWDRIPKNRLQALRADPETGALQLALACACHVFPFEYQPGIVVLDIKPGPAPTGSSFEQAFKPISPQGPSPAKASIAPPGYDWLALDHATKITTPEGTELALPTGSVSLEPLRLELLEEISRGAAEGVVDMRLPGKPPDNGLLGESTLPWSQIHIGPPPDAALDATAKGKDGRTPKGEACVPDEKLAIAEWGADRPPLELLAEARSGLYGEFDLLDHEAALRAVRLHLYLGFGAEAAQYAKLLSGSGATDDRAVFQSLSVLVDGDNDPQSPFRDMLACDGAAALWAAMALQEFPPGATVNGDAISRSFLALPAHLRGALGPDLADILLANDQTEAASVVRNSVERTPGVPAATVALLDAKVELHGGEDAAALELAAEAVAADGRSAEEWIALVEAHFRDVTPMPLESVEALRAFEGEMEASENPQDYFRALALAELLANQTEAGFRIAEERGLPGSDLWQVAAVLAEDDDFLAHAVASKPGSIAPDVAVKVAKRLVGLGFPDAAMDWLDPVGPHDGAEKRQIAAQAEFARGDASQALALLDGLTAPEDHALRARVLVRLGRVSEARDAYQAAGLPDEALRLAAWQGAWPDLQAAQTPLWAGAASDPTPDLPEDAGPLARSAAILEASANSRSSIAALLAGVAEPKP